MIIFLELCLFLFKTFLLNFNETIDKKEGKDIKIKDSIHKYQEENKV